MSDQEKDPFKIVDPTILTLQEHKIIGSGTLRPDMEANPYTPQAVLDGKSPKEVGILRLRQREILSPSASRYFGIEQGLVAVVNLNQIDLGTGVVKVKEPRLIGVHNEVSGNTNRDISVLERYQLNDEGKRMFLVPRDSVGIESIKAGSREGEVA